MTVNNGLRIVPVVPHVFLKDQETQTLDREEKATQTKGKWKIPHTFEITIDGKNFHLSTILDICMSRNMKNNMFIKNENIEIEEIQE